MLLLAPFAPFLCAELWSELGGEGEVLRQSWPVSDAGLAKEDEIEIPVQINGKLRAVIRLAADSSKGEIEKSCSCRREGSGMACREDAGEDHQCSREAPQFGHPVVSNAENRKLRATQSIVAHMGFVWSHPSLIFIEVAWRWLFGVPFLLIAYGQAQQISMKLPPSAAGLDRVEFQNPWLSSVLLAEAIARYEPLVIAVLRWLVPAGVVAWSILSGIGRTSVLARMNAIDPATDQRSKQSFLRRTPGIILLQALWMIALLACVWGWFSVAGWASDHYITIGAQPDLVAYLCWLIFITLAIYVLWAILSWTIAIAPILFCLELDNRPLDFLRALRRSFSLGRVLSSKLVEVSLVLAIVKIMLIVLDMVFSAAPLPFADQFGPDALHFLYVIVAVAFLLASDYFHVVRLRSFWELWRHYRR